MRDMICGPASQGSAPAAVHAPAGALGVLKTRPVDVPIQPVTFGATTASIGPNATAEASAGGTSPGRTMAAVAGGAGGAGTVIKAIGPPPVSVHPKMSTPGRDGCCSTVGTKGAVPGPPPRMVLSWIPMEFSGAATSCTTGFTI